MFNVPIVFILSCNYSSFISILRQYLIYLVFSRPLQIPAIPIVVKHSVISSIRLSNHSSHHAHSAKLLHQCFSCRLSVQGASVLLQVRTLCPGEVSFRPLLAGRFLHLPLSLALFCLTWPEQAVETLATCANG